MTHDEMPDERERLSRMEAIAYVAEMLPELATLAASEPHLQALLQQAQTEAHQIVTRFKGTRVWRETVPPGEAVG